MYFILYSHYKNENRNYDVWVWYLYKCILPFNASLRKGNVYLSNHGCYYTQACHQVVFIRFFFVKMHADESFNIRTCFLFLGIFVIDCQTCSVYSSCAEMKGPCFILYFCVPFWFQIPLRRFRQVSCSLYILNVLGLFIIVIFFMIISFNTFVLPILLGVFGQNYFNAMHGCYSEC